MGDGRNRKMGHRGRRRSRAVPMAWVLLVYAAAAAEGAPLPDNAAITLELSGAVVRVDMPDSPRKDLTLHLSRRSGRWATTVWGMARKYNQAIHEGTLLPDADGPGPGQIELVMHDDPWVEGGFGRYGVRLGANGDFAAGSYTGWCNGRDVAGPVKATIRPWRPRAGQVAMPASGEHPRLLLCPRDVPALRKKAQTAFGRRIIAAIRARLAAGDPRAALDRALGHGFLYALLGEAAHGDAAVPLAMEKVWDPTGPHAHDTSRTLLAVALAYDLAYDRFGPRDLDLVNRFLGRAVGIVNARKGLTGNWNNGPNSNWTAIGCGGAGMASLAVLGERGVFGLAPPRACAPAVIVAGQQPGDPARGVPVSAFADSVLLRKWLWAGPFAPSGRHPLAELGGPAKARPDPSRSFDYGGKAWRFAPLPASAVVKPCVPWDDDAGECIDCPRAERGSVSYLYTVLDAARRCGGVLRCDHPAGYGGGAAWINGVEVSTGTAVVLEPGRHHVLIEVKGGRVCPRFERADAGRLLSLWRRYQWLQQAWSDARRRHEKTEQREDAPIHLRIATWHGLLWCMHALGDHGWKTETESYQFISLDMMLPFAAAYEKVTGEPLAPGAGLSWVLPLGLIRQCPGGGGGYGGRGTGLSTRFLCYAIGMVPQEVKPALVWELARRLADDDALARLDCRSLVYAFLNFPLDVECVHPEEGMPKVIADRRKGAFVFRNRYADGDDFVTHVFLRSERPRGPAWFLPEAGSFRISGLGAAWAVMGGGQNKRDPKYSEENVVEVAGGTGTGCGKLLYFVALPGGSGVVGADMSDVYNHGGGGGIRAERHVAVDYSGRCGAPALVAVADRIAGGGTKRWLMHTEGRRIETAGRRFTIHAKGGATLCGRLVAPESITLSASAQTLSAASEAEEADFFVIMTIQKGGAPPATAAGTGLESVVRVGRRVVRFADGKLELSE